MESEATTLAIQAWHVWAAGAILLLISELLTPGGFLLASLAIGALASSLCAALDWGLNAQIIVFVVASLLVYYTIRPIYLKALSKQRDNRPIGAEAYIGKVGRITEAAEAGASGRMELGGESWKARDEAGHALQAGSQVKVIALDGLTLIVSQI
jgi:membrane protein implicated in regulation of membrane protease activity